MFGQGAKLQRQNEIWRVPADLQPYIKAADTKAALTRMVSCRVICMAISLPVRLIYEPDSCVARLLVITCTLKSDWLRTNLH